MEKKIFVIEHDTIGERIDRFLAQQYTGVLSRSKIKKLIECGGITVNEKKATPHYQLKYADTVTVEYIELTQPRVVSENIPLDIVFEDADIIIVNKPAGMVVHPGAGNMQGTLVNALYYHTHGAMSLSAGADRAGIVHRLDKDTSGLLVVAKNDTAHMRLAAQFKSRSVKKVYAAIVRGVVQRDHGTCEEPIGRGRLFRKKMIVLPTDGKHAVSVYHVITRFRNATLLNVQIFTGRTHQIRVHMAHMGYPILGDKTYGHASPLIKRHCLHAMILEFKHPTTRKTMNFEIVLPPDMEKVLQILSQ